MALISKLHPPADTYFPHLQDNSAALDTQHQDKTRVAGNHGYHAMVTMVLVVQPKKFRCVVWIALRNETTNLLVTSLVISVGINYCFKMNNR